MEPANNPIKDLVDQLKDDPEYRYAWKANIAMAFKDRVGQYKKENDKQVLSNEDIHIVANEAAEYFLQLICDEIEYPEGR